MRVRFGNCLFDPETRELFRGGKGVPVAPKAFPLLEILLESRARAVKRDELRDLLWRRGFVADGSLSRLMNDLRSAIGDDADEPRYIRTVHRFGYAFSGEAVDEAGPRAPAEAGDAVYK